MATLSLLIQESLTLDGNDKSNSYKKEITGVNHLDHRTVMLLSGSETTLFNLSDIVGAGQFVTSSLKYSRISNLSTDTSINLLVSSSTESFNFKVDAGGTFMLNTSKVSGSANTDSSSLQYDDIAFIAAEPSASDAKIEYYLATS